MSRRRKPPVVSRADLHERLMMCAGTEGYGADSCSRLAIYVGWALRGASGGRRTDFTLFGVCELHLFHRQGIDGHLASEGFANATVVPYAKLPEVLDMLEDAGLVRVAA